MIVYTNTKAGFSRQVENQDLVDNLYQLIREKHRGVAKSEILSWRNSLQYMYMILNDPAVPQDAGIAIEYVIPSTSKRIDFLISGYDHQDRSNVVIIELKQWESAAVVSEKDSIVQTVLGGGLREVAHPCYQAWSYAQLLKDFNQNVEEQRISVHPCAYLHNYRRAEDDPFVNSFSALTRDTPLFTSHDTNKLRKFIKRYIQKGDQTKILFEIDNGKIRPSKSLQDSIRNMLAGNPEFIMVDDQKVAYEEALTLSKKCQKDCKKRVLIVEGGPGTGKSVVAVNLLVTFINKGLVAQYITKNSAPRDVYNAMLKGSMKKSSIDNLFKSSGSYVDAEENELDVAIVDEAHRLNAKSGLFRRGENQVAEIIHASKFTIFFVDEKQMISTSDIGSLNELETQSRKANAEIRFGVLQSQFRCNGSNGYLQWLDAALDLTDDKDMVYDFDFDFRIYDDPNDLHEEIRRKNVNNKARLLAGYCWEWPKERRNDPDFHDIEIKDKNFSISWNLNNTRTYALDPDSVNEAGCIHTSQGLEFDYVGVIIGDDLVFEPGRLKTDLFKRANSDHSTKGLKTLYKRDPEQAKKIADRLIKNTYRTLLTRGQKGCYIYCTDKKLSNYFKDLLGSYKNLESRNQSLLRVAEESPEYGDS